MERKGGVDADLNLVERWRDEIDKFSGDLARKYSKIAVNKTDQLATQNSILKEMNDTIMSGGSKDGKMFPACGLVDEIAIDATTGFPFRSGVGLLKKSPVGGPLPKQAVQIDVATGKPLLDPKTGKEVMQNVKTGNQLYNVTIDQMDPAKVAALRKTLQTKYKAKPEQVTDLLDTFTAGREKFAEQFTSIGRRFTPEAWDNFTKELPKYLNDIVDRGYSVFRNNRAQKTVALNYPPTKAVLKETFDWFKTAAKAKGYDVDDSVIERLVKDTWESATIEKGLKFESKAGPAGVKLQLPQFLTDSLGHKLINPGETGIKTTTTNLSDITGVAVPIIKKLLGKNQNPMSTLVDGVTNLSTQVKSGEFFDNIVRKSNQLKLEYDKWLDGGKGGKEPELPFLFDTKGEAHKYVGGGFGDVAQIGKEGTDAARHIDRFVDPKSPLKPVDAIEAAKRASVEGKLQEITNPVAGKWALTDVAKSFLPTQSWLDGVPGQIYNNLVSYPKGTSQMAKTILAPFTHVRNFLSATAFAGANGILPFGNTADVKAAWRALQAGGPGMRSSNQFYQEL